MLTLPPSVKIFIYTQPTDMRCGFNKLSMLTENFMRKDPFSGKIPTKYTPVKTGGEY